MILSFCYHTPVVECNTQIPTHIRRAFPMKRFSLKLDPVFLVSFLSCLIITTTTFAEEKISSTKFTPAKIKVPEGFTVELAAAPPLVGFPMMGCFDDQGHLYLAESAGENIPAKGLEEKLPNCIRMLTDTDGDGKFDKSTIFADNLTFPQGALWHKGALYVTSPPNVWKFEDTTGNGVADKRTILVNQFGYTGNAASIHGCFLGPEGRIYWCDGFHGHEFRDKNNKVTSKKIGSYIFSCKTDGSDVQIHCGGGMDNPVEIDFTEEGEMLGTVNILYTRPRIDCLVHWQYGGAYPHRKHVLNEMKVTGDVLGPIHKFGHVAVSGMTRYRSSAWGKDYQNSLFVTFYNEGSVKRVSLKRKGSTFETTQHEFFSSDTPDFHPTDVLEDADGSLLVIDTGAWFTRGCPTSQLAKPEIKGAIYRIRRKDAKRVVDPRGNKIDWKKIPHQQVIDLLDDDRFAVRERAIVECEDRGKKIVATLSENMKNKSVRSRRNTVWALTRIAVTYSSEEALAAIRYGLNDSDESVKQAVCKSIFTTKDPQTIDLLFHLLESSNNSAQTRREAAHAYGRLRTQKNGEHVALLFLQSAAFQNEVTQIVDRELEHALIYALIEMNEYDATYDYLALRDPQLKRIILTTLDQMNSSKLDAKTVSEEFLRSTDTTLQQAGLAVFLRHPEWEKEGASLLAEFLRSEVTIKENKFLVRGLLTAFRKNKQVAESIGDRLADIKTSKYTTLLLLDSIGQSPTVPIHKSWITPLSTFLDLKDQPIVEKAIAAVANIQTTSFNKPLQKIMANENMPKVIRASAWSAIHAGRKMTDDEFELIIGMLDESASPAESARASQVINTAKLNKEQMLELAPLLQQAGPLLLQSLLPLFQRTGDNDVRKEFLNVMSKARGLDTLSPPQFSDVIKKYPAELLPQANKILRKLKQNEADKLARIDTLLPLLKKGDAVLGHKVFISEKAKCSTCHRINKEGGQIGPDLSTIGRIRKDRDFLEAIVFPSSNFVREYEPYIIVTNAGLTHSGLITRETKETIFIQPSTGKPIPIARDDIDSLLPSTVSIMPNGLEKALTEKELADLIAYLKTLK